MLGDVPLTQQNLHLFSLFFAPDAEKSDLCLSLIKREGTLMEIKVNYLINVDSKNKWEQTTGKTKALVIHSVCSRVSRAASAEIKPLFSR